MNKLTKQQFLAAFKSDEIYFVDAPWHWSLDKIKEVLESEKPEGRAHRFVLDITDQEITFSSGILCLFPHGEYYQFGNYYIAHWPQENNNTVIYKIT